MLDRTDNKIVRELQNNARLSNKELASRIGLAPSSCLVRVRNLESSGVLKGYHANIEPGLLGVSLQAMISVRLSHHSQAEVESFSTLMLSLSEVRQLYHVAGSNDFLLHVWVQNSQHLRDLVMHSINSLKEVAHIETGLIFEHTLNPDFPLFET